MRIISIGEILWDVYEDEEHIGGAPFNFSVYVNSLGHEVYFISAVGDDGKGRQLLKQITNYGLTTKFINKIPDYPTGYVNIKNDKKKNTSY